MSNQLLPEDRFSENIQALISIIHEPLSKCYNLKLTQIHPSLLDLVIKFIDNISKKNLVENFIDKSYKNWDKIFEKDINYFLENISEIFYDTPFKDIELFKIVYEAIDENNKKILTKDIEADLWDALHGMVKICIVYIHNERIPTIKEVNGEKKYIYKNKFKTHINLNTESTKWNKVLVW